ncbi:17770_t:CDS:2 [Funneliformis caledonium]|uniref:17770_t:CDS:1 n=1 Tax=Funneliformis caledonium TaxID=1117310 RepID=A0A9N8VBW0_9GLOM|nr:17770_t:CDS:2 [Funneliformis caledonium]
MYVLSRRLRISVDASRDIKSIHEYVNDELRRIEVDTSTSTSTTIAGNETVSLADKIKKYDMAKLIDFLLDFKIGTTVVLADFAKESKYSIGGNGIGTIRQFLPATYKLEDDDEKLV